MEIGPSHRATEMVNRPQASKTVASTDSREEPRSGDSLQISEAGRRQLAELADRVRAAKATVTEADSGSTEEFDNDGLRTDRVRLAKARVQSGYYDQPEIREKIAGTLADILQEPPQEPDQSE